MKAKINKFLKLSEDKQVLELELLDEKQREDFLIALKIKNGRLQRKLKAKLDSNKREKVLFRKLDVNIDNLSTQKIKISILTSNPFQPRKVFNVEKLKELALSIKNDGLISPILVSLSSDNEYTIVAGERRVRASKLNFIDEIEAKIIKDVDNAALKRLSIVENTHRDDLKIIEIALAYKALNDDGMTINDISDEIGESRSKVGRLIKISKMPTEIIEIILKNDYNKVECLELISSIKDEEFQKDLITKTINKDLTAKEIKNIIQKPKKEIEPKIKASFFEKLSKKQININNFLKKEINLFPENKKNEAQNLLNIIEEAQEKLWLLSRKPSI